MFFSDQVRANQRQLEVALRRIETVTGKNFKRDVKFETQTRKEFRQFLKREMQKSFPGDQLRQLGRIYQLLALLPVRFHLQDELPDLYRDQVGAYYDPKRGKIFQVSGGLPNRSQFFLYLHEGVHALQDQHYDLKTKQEQFTYGATLDKQLAFSFTVEGHANLVAMASQLNVSSLDQQFFNSIRYSSVFEMMARLTDLTDDQLDAITQIFGQGKTPAARSLRKLQGIPLILVQQMTDPYLLGQNLWYKNSARSGFDTTREWLRTIPSSTRELLFSSVDDSGETTTYADVGEYETSMGSYLTMRWLKQFRRKPAWAKHLTKDRVSLLNSNGDDAVLWRLKFSDSTHAKQFIRQLSSFIVQVNDRSNGQRLREFRRTGRVRYIWLKRTKQEISLFFDDDTKIGPEITPYGYDPDKMSSEFPPDVD